MLSEKDGENSMPTLDQIQEQINKYKFGSVYAKEREVKELPTILSADEELLAITGGQYHDGHGILVGTNIRLIFIDKVIPPKKAST